MSWVRASDIAFQHTHEAGAGHRGFACLDWTDLKHHYRNCNIVTVPIEAPEGVLGALTGAAGPEKPEQDLTSEMQALSKSLAHSLTFCKCKSDLQVRYTFPLAFAFNVSSHLKGEHCLDVPIVVTANVTLHASSLQGAFGSCMSDVAGFL